jgi:hypothetical protein
LAFRDYFAELVPQQARSCGGKHELTIDWENKR